MAEIYHFTHQQLAHLLGSTIAMFQEYRDVHGKTEDLAQFHSIQEMLEGLHAETELIKSGELKKASLQILGIDIVKAAIEDELKQIAPRR